MKEAPVRPTQTMKHKLSPVDTAMKTWWNKHELTTLKWSFNLYRTNKKHIMLNNEEFVVHYVFKNSNSDK